MCATLDVGVCVLFGGEGVVVLGFIHLNPICVGWAWA